MRHPESQYIHNLDKPSDREIEENSFLAEDIVVDSFNSGLEGYEARLSSESEDSGKKDIGPRQTVDAVAYREGRPVMGLQITTAEDHKTIQRKMQELMDHPFIRLPEMSSKDLAIPKVLVYLNREMVKTYQQDHNIKNHPEITLQVLDGAIKSLQFDLSKTKNPIEKKAIESLIQSLTEEQRKLTH